MLQEKSYPQGDHILAVVPISIYTSQRLAEVLLQLQ